MSSKESRAPGTAPADRRQPLTRERLAEAALALIDREGLDALSTRRLGAALGVEAMAIYHHFPSKEHLLDAVAERLLGEVDLPPDTVEWIGWLRRTARSYRGVAKRHPHAFALLAMRRFFTPLAYRFVERQFAVLRRAGFDATMTARIFRTLGYFVNGAGLADVATELARRGERQPLALQTADERATFPRLAEVAPHLAQAELDDIFETGLRLILEGFRKLPKRRKTVRRQPPNRA